MPDLIVFIDVTSNGLQFIILVDLSLTTFKIFYVFVVVC